MRILMPLMMPAALLVAALSLSALICYQHVLARTEHELSGGKARQAAASVLSRQRSAELYRQLRQQAEELEAKRALGVPVSAAVLAMQGLAGRVHGASYSFSSMPDAELEGASLRQADFELHAPLPDVESFISLVEQVEALRAGVFTPRRCRLGKERQNVRVECSLGWASVRRQAPHSGEG